MNMRWNAATASLLYVLVGCAGMKGAQELTYDESEADDRLSEVSDAIDYQKKHTRMAKYSDAVEASKKFLLQHHISILDVQKSKHNNDVIWLRYKLSAMANGVCEVLLSEMGGRWIVIQQFCPMKQDQADQISKHNDESE